MRPLVIVAHDGAALHEWLMQTGRGPSQCITRVVEHAFVPVRGGGSSAFEGYGRAYEPAMKILVMPGIPISACSWQVVACTDPIKMTLPLVKAQCHVDL